jgi:hypothetical protein
MTWAPLECTLPLGERPSRVKEFDDLFTTALRAVARPEPTLLLLTLDGSDRVEATTRDLVARETACCSLFDFTLTRVPDGRLQLAVRVPAQRVRVLDELAARATSASATSGRSA